MSSLKDTITTARLPHLHYERAVRAAVSRMAFMASGSVIAMVGPTRVGKSRAVREAAEQAFPGRDESTIPYVVVDCSRTDAGFTSTRYLTLDLLGKLQHPFYVDDTYRVRISQTETNARLQLRRAIHHRKTQLIVFDEAHHLLRVKNRAGREAVLESLKCLGNETGAIIFLVGGYELLSSCFCSAHLNGRLSLIEFPRYDATQPQLQEYCRILASFDQFLPWAKGHSMLAMKEFIYAGTLGCCGLVAKWVLDALAEMWIAGGSRLRKEHFCKAHYQNSLEEIAQDIKFGEGVLRPITEPPHSEAPGPKPRPRRGRRPGRRKPHRDPVG